MKIDSDSASNGALEVLLRKEFLGCRAGAATESRPYRAFHCCGRRQLRHDGLQTFGSAGAGRGNGIHVRSKRSAPLEPGGSYDIR